MNIARIATRYGSELGEQIDQMAVATGLYSNRAEFLQDAIRHFVRMFVYNCWDFEREPPQVNVFSIPRAWCHVKEELETFYSFGGEIEMTMIRVPQPLYARIQEYSDQMGLSLSDFVRVAIITMMDALAMFLKGSNEYDKVVYQPYLDEEGCRVINESKIELIEYRCDSLIKERRMSKEKTSRVERWNEAQLRERRCICMARSPESIDYLVPRREGS